MKRTRTRTRRLKTTVSVYDPSNVQGPIIVRGRVVGVGLVGVQEERRTIITALLELGIQRFSLSRFLCCLFAL